jgi:uncharacterized protein YjbI with pentapeptide repeats
VNNLRRWIHILLDDEAAGAPGWAFGHVVRLVNAALAGPRLTNVGLHGASFSGAALSGPTLSNVTIT